MMITNDKQQAVLATLYSSKSVAARGAKRAGFDDEQFSVIAEDGKFRVAVVVNEDDQAESDAVDAEMAEDAPDAGSNPTDAEIAEAEATEGLNAPAPMGETIEPEDALAADADDATDPGVEPTEEEKAAMAAKNFKIDPNGEYEKTVEDMKAEAAPPKAKTYKELASATRSSVLNPVKMIHEYLSANPQLTRKDAVADLVGKGINFATARTQYQRWFTLRKG